MVKMVYKVPEHVLSLEENVKVSSSTTTATFSVKQREAVTMDLEVFITFTLTTLTKMSLIIAGIEVNPGPTTMFLLDVPHEVETSNTPLTLVCNDGILVGDITILSKYSSLLNNLVEPLFYNCSSNKNSIHLPDFTITSTASLIQLLTTGEPVVQTQKEGANIICLQRTLGCTGVTGGK